MRLLGRDGQGCILSFGPTDECRIFVDPSRPNFGLIMQDVRQILFENPLEPGGAQVIVDGFIQSQGFPQKSAREHKENIRTIENPLETIQNLRGVYFDWKDSKQADLGFIADEVADVVSEAVLFDKEDEEKATAVKYSNLVALTVESIKAQQKQIEAQQEMIHELQKQIEELRNRVD